jgi:hypothetical protein
VPRNLAGQNAVFIDGGAFNFEYTNNSCISANGGFFDLDSCAYGSVSNNICRVPSSTDAEYTEDAIASWEEEIWTGSATTIVAGNFTYGAQTANNFTPVGGTNISIAGKSFLNCGVGALRLIAARGCHITDNVINHGTLSGLPIMIGNSVIGGIQYNAVNNSLVSNNIQWSPGSTQAVISELSTWSGSSWTWSGTDKNWVADNRIFGNCFEFSKDASSGSPTGTLISSEAAGLSSTEQTTILRQNFSGAKATSFYGPTGDLHLRYLDTQGQLRIPGDVNNRFRGM